MLLPCLHDCLLQYFHLSTLLLLINFWNVLFVSTGFLMSPMSLWGQSLGAQWTHFSFVLVPYPHLPIFSPIAHQGETNGRMLSCMMLEKCITVNWWEVKLYKCPNWNIARHTLYNGWLQSKPTPSLWDPRYNTVNDNISTWIHPSINWIISWGGPGKFLIQIHLLNHSMHLL